MRRRTKRPTAQPAQRPPTTTTPRPPTANTHRPPTANTQRPRTADTHRPLIADTQRSPMPNTPRPGTSNQRSATQKRVVVGLLMVGLLTGCFKNGTPRKKPVTIPGAGGHVLIFGDSWTYGTNAMPRMDGYAYIVTQHYGWNSDIEGGPDTGYVNDGGGRGTYAERFAKLREPVPPQLIIIQGGLNDTGQPVGVVQKAATAFFKQVKAKYPAATVIVVGSISPKGSGDSVVEAVNTEIRAATVADQVMFIDPDAENWFTADRVKAYIDQTDYHPNNAGHNHYAMVLEHDLGPATKTG